MNDDADKLMNYMSELSEEAYFAAWMDGLEYDLWQAVVEGPRNYGRILLQEEHINKLKELSNLCSGWIVFDDEKGQIFVLMEQWLKMYERNKEMRGKYYEA